MQKRIRVIDSFGVPLAWANVLTAQGKGTTTDDEGYATVEAASNNQQITISYMGFQSRTITFGNLSNEVILEPDVNQLPEVVVTAPKKEKNNNWATYAGLAIGVIGLLVSLSGNDEPQKVVPVKPNTRKINL